VLNNYCSGGFIGIKVYFCRRKKMIMTIAKDKVVSLIYELRIGSASGEVIESLNNENPLVFLYGFGNLLPKFEEKIEGMNVGDKFNFNLSSTDAYGEFNSSAVIEVPISAFEVNGTVDNDMLSIGNVIPMRDNQGNRLNGVVKEVTGSNVKMDFNHPLAGSHLYFNGEITDIREATEEELTHGHIHSSCGCGGECEDGCGDSAEAGCSSGSCGCGC
jgi:FKBP-type peptidyl-prolyl cis-trans isomerase SlyD